MDAKTSTQETLTALEDMLVREFRVLQSLVSISKEERMALARPDASRLLPLVEEKEALLDELAQLEENRRVATQILATNSGLSSNLPSVREILPFVDPGTADRLSRLGDGITTLISQARDLNVGNCALAASRVEWLDAAQAYLLNLVQPPTGYYPPGTNPPAQYAAALDVDHRA